MGVERTPTAAPRLSIVVPVYRVEAYLGDCLDSILSYYGDAIEVIAVNDGSPDRCGQILDGYALRDSRLRVVHLPVNVGLGPARNAGLDHASGDYVWFVDADDWLPPGSIEAVLGRLGSTCPDVLIVDHAEVFEDGRMVPRSSAEALPGLTAPIRLADRPGLLRLAQSACTKVARRRFLAEARLRFQPGWYEDSSFSHPLLMAASRIDLLQRICYAYRQRGQGGITTSVSHRHFEVFDQYRCLFAMVDEAAGAYDAFRPELFRLMVNHYLVIVGNEWRLPRGMHRAFFHRAAEDYRRWLPADGYPVPGGATGLKHWLLRRQAYPAFAALRSVNRTVAKVCLKLRPDARPDAAELSPRPAGPGQRFAGETGRPAPTGGGLPRSHRVDPSRKRLVAEQLAGYDRRLAGYDQRFGRESVLTSDCGVGCPVGGSAVSRDIGIDGIGRLR